MSESPLYDDVHAAARFHRDLAVPESGTGNNVTVNAVERGRRQRPDGTVEDYERIEFDRR